MTSSREIAVRMVQELLGSRLIDNSLRGYWCEYAVAETLGPACKVVSSGWYPWDLQFGNSDAAFPKRIRLQVKNSATLQNWHRPGDPPSDSSFNLTFRKQPSYFATDHPHTPCETVGFLCDLFVLCHHEISAPDIADHTDPSQWQIYLLPVDPILGAITQNEIENLIRKTRTSRQSSLQRRPATMRRGIRGRAPITPIALPDLKIAHIYTALNLDEI